MALAQPFIYNAPCKLSSQWFPENERVFATAVGTNANIFGIALGYFFPSIFIDKSDISNLLAAQTHIFWCLLTLSVISTLIAFPVIFTMKDKPPSPPSYSQDSAHQKHGNLMQEFKIITKNKFFMMFATSFMMSIGVFYAFTTVLG